VGNILAFSGEGILAPYWLYVISTVLPDEGVTTRVTNTSPTREDRTGTTIVREHVITIKEIGQVVAGEVTLKEPPSHPRFAAVMSFGATTDRDRLYQDRIS
jgi:hypothetical protein